MFLMLLSPCHYIITCSSTSPPLSWITLFPPLTTLYSSALLILSPSSLTASGYNVQQSHYWPGFVHVRAYISEWGFGSECHCPLSHLAGWPDKTSGVYLIGSFSVGTSTLYRGNHLTKDRPAPHIYMHSYITRKRVIRWKRRGEKLRERNREGEGIEKERKKRGWEVAGMKGRRR